MTVTEREVDMAVMSKEKLEQELRKVQVWGGMVLAGERITEEDKEAFLDAWDSILRDYGELLDIAQEMATGVFEGRGVKGQTILRAMSMGLVQDEWLSEPEK